MNSVPEPKPTTKQRRRPGGGRKPLLDEADRTFLSSYATEHPYSTLPELKAELASVTGKRASEATIGKALKELGFQRAKRRKALSTPAPQSPPRYRDVHRREPSPGKYPSSLTDGEWQVVESLMNEASDNRGRKAIHDQRLMMDAIFYLVRTGCQWRMLPKDFPPWTAVWSRFRRLRDNGVLERLYDTIHAFWREAAQRGRQPTAGIIDSQSVATTEKGGLQVTTLARRSRAASAT